MASASRGERVPRKAPDTVREHRLTFGTLERQELLQAKTELLALERRRQNLQAAEAMAVPVAVTVTGLAGVFLVMKTWENLNDKIPSFDGALNGITEMLLGTPAKEEAILRDATEQAAQDGKPLSFFQRVRNRFAFDAFRGGGGVF